jgi:uncharacterized protein YbjT (DUF2867 family)
MKIVVTGSLGHISQPLAKKLIQQGHTVTVVSSSPGKQQAIEALGAIAAIGSVNDVDFLSATFTGADAAYVMVPPDFTVPDSIAYYRNTGNTYAQAIQRAGLKRVVHLSSIGAHLEQGTGIILGSHEIEGILNKLSGVAVTHLRPGYFYYNLYHLAGMIKAAGFMGANYGEDKVVMVDPIDIAAAAADELVNAAGTQQVRYVASGEYTGHEVAQIFGAAIGQPDLKWVTFTDEQTSQSLLERGIPAHTAQGIVDIGASIRSGAMREDYDRHPPHTQGSVKLTAVAGEFVKAFNKA